MNNYLISHCRSTIDGKTSRTTYNRSVGRKALHRVAYVCSGKPPGAGSTGAPPEKSNEIITMPLLLVQLALSGCIVTIDSMGTQTKIAQQIID
jgi:hypothetical protein